MTIERGEPNTFQNQVSKVFNELPKTIRKCSDQKQLYKEVKRFYFDVAMAKMLAQ